MPKKMDRLVSLAPSLTECLFAIGAGERLVGVSSFCSYPEAAQHLPKIGGYTDTNYEAILALQPDAVLLLIEHERARIRLDELGIDYHTLDTSTLPALKQSITSLGELTGKAQQAAHLLNQIEHQLRSIQEETALFPPKGVIISIGRNMGTGGLSEVYLAGPNTLYTELLSFCNASNRYTGSLPYAKVSYEGLQRMNPDVIIDLVPDLDQSKALNHADVRNDWNKLQQVNAVRDQQVYVYGGDYVCIPGPRIVQVLHDFARAIHPERASTRISSEAPSP